MNRLFISFFLDEDVSILVGTLLRARGFEALTVRDANRRGFSDEEQLSFAAENGMTLFTHNRIDFERLYTEWLTAGKTHGGILIATRRLPHELVRRALPLLDSVTSDEMVNQLRYL